jgi:hypothetical protein
LLDYLPSITIYSAIADPGNWSNKNHKGQVAGSDCFKLWDLLHSGDIDGCGNVIVDLKVAAHFLGKSLYTIRRWLKAGLRLGFFRGSKRVGTKQYRIFYASKQNVCKSLQITDIGACIEVEVSDLNKSKFLATEAEALKLQNQSKWLEKEKKRKNLKKCVPAAETLTTSEICSGAILCKADGDRFTYLKFYAHAHGGSQKRIAHEMGRHPSTIQRRLSNGYRQKHGLAAIAKTQIFAPVQRDAPNSQGIRKIVTHGEGKIWKTRLGLFKVCPNVYDVPHQLVSKRYLRGKIKRALKAHALAEEAREWLEADNAYQEWLASPEAQSLRQSAQTLINKSGLSTEKIAPPENIEKS